MKTLYSATAAARPLQSNPARLQRWPNYGHFRPKQDRHSNPVAHFAARRPVRLDRASALGLSLAHDGFQAECLCRLKAWMGIAPQKAFWGAQPDAGIVRTPVMIGPEKR